VIVLPFGFSRQSSPTDSRQIAQRLMHVTQQGRSVSHSCYSLCGRPNSLILSAETSATPIVKRRTRHTSSTHVDHDLQMLCDSVQAARPPT